MNRRRWSLATGVSLVAAVTMTGCGLPDRVVGLHDAPVEKTDGAPFSQAAAEEITARVLGKALEAQASSDKAIAVRTATLVGPALRLAEVRQKFEKTIEPNTLAVPPKPTILGMSAGHGWPRTIVATSQLEGVQQLHVLIADTPTSAFKVWVTVPMLPGASVPALPPLADGTTTSTSGVGLIASPVQVLQAYADQLDIPADTSKSAIVGIGDAFAKGVRAASAAQVKTLGKLGTFTRLNTVYEGDVLGIRLADGGLLAFGQMVRKDTVKPTKKAKKLTLSGDIAKLAGRNAVTSLVQLQWLETIAVIIPATKAATVVGVNEQMRSVIAK